MRFAVRRLGNPYASPRSRRPSDGDVTSGIYVSIACVSTRRTCEDRLALARLSIHFPACGATLRSVRRMNFLNSSLGLLIQPGDEHSPAVVENSPVEGGFLGDSAAGLCGGATRRARHRSHIKRFDADQIEAHSQARCDFLTPVLTHVGLLAPQSGNVSLYSRPSVGSTLAASQSSLQPEQSTLSLRAQPSDCQEFPGAQGSTHLDAPVDSYYEPVARGRLWRRDGSEGDVPATRTVQRHPERLRTLRYRAGHAESHPTHLGYPDMSDTPVHPLDVGPLDRYDPEPLVSAGFSPGRSAVSSRKVVTKRLGKVPQSLLLHRLTSCTQPLVFGARLRELTTLLDVSGRTVAPRTPPQVLFHGKIPHETCMSAMLAQKTLLRASRVQPVSGHEFNVAVTSDIRGGRAGHESWNVSGLTIPAC